MPTALFFIPCERPLLDAMTNQLTLISVLCSVQPTPLPTVEDAPPQLRGEQFQDARYLLPPFFLVANWSKNSGEDSLWEQHVTITAPDGRETIITPTIPFDFETPFHMVFHRTNIITGRLFGVSILSLKLRQTGSEEWQTVAQYPLHIEEFLLPAEESPPLESEINN